jgi:hypothetical protein
MTNKCIKMIQTSKHKWRIETSNGNVLVEDLVIDSLKHAEDYVKGYASSFVGWSYELIPIEKEVT